MQAWHMLTSAAPAMYLKCGSQLMLLFCLLSACYFTAATVPECVVPLSE